MRLLVLFCCLWLLPGEADSADALRDGRLSLKERLEAPDSPLPQPATLTLRKSSQPAPWNGFQRIYAEPLVMGCLLYTSRCV